MKNVVFDFDGVVCDSSDECMVTSWNAWQNWQSLEGFRKDLSLFSREERLAFRRVRPRVKGAGEYYILRRAFAENILIENQEQYEELETQWAEYIEIFKAVFFEMRNQLRKENLDDWIGLHPVYDNVIDVMRTLHEQNRLFIATLKDAESVHLILNKQGFEITDDHLLDQSQIKSKLQALDHFRSRLNCDKEDLVFIDDNVTHLLKPHAAGYPVYLTTWGRVMDEYLQIAMDNHILLLQDAKDLFSNI